MQRSDFKFELPDSLIAQFPPARRGDSRLLELEGTSGLIRDRNFSELPDLLLPNATRRADLSGRETRGDPAQLLEIGHPVRKVA